MLRERGIDLGESFERVGGLWLPAAAAPVEPAPRPVGVDLFCGAGGFSLGFHQAGWHVAAACEWDAWAAMTYLVNLGGPDTEIVFLGDDVEKRWQKALDKQGRLHDKGGVPPDAGSGWIAGHDDEPACDVFYLGDVRQLTGKRIAADLGRDVDAVFGGPPCQGFSRAGQRNVMDPRNSLVFDFMRIVCELRPKTFVMENVPGMLDMVTPEGLPVIDAIARIAEDGGFGTYEAIKRSLTASAGHGGALRTTGVGRDKGEGGTRGLPMQGRDRLAAAREEPAQLDLLGDAA